MNKNIFAISGSNEFLRLRKLNDLLYKHSCDGWRIVRVDGDNTADLRAALSLTDLFCPTEVLVVVDNAEKASLPLLKAHQEDDDAFVVVLLHVASDVRDKSPFGEFMKTLKKSHYGYKAPSEWDKEKVASEFCVYEMKQMGKTLPSDVADVLVSVIGSDLGFLYFELKKISLYADVTGITNLELRHIKGCLAPITEVTASPIIDALAQKNKPALLKALYQFNRVAKGKQTIRICYFLFDIAYKWLVAIDARDHGIDFGTLDKSWYYKNKVLPQVAKWSRQDVVKLLKGLSESERAVLSGAVNPWIVFTSRLVDLCNSR